MQINIETYESGEIDYVTVTAQGRTQGQKLLDKLVRRFDVSHEPSETERARQDGLRAAAAMLREMAKVPYGSSDESAWIHGQVANLLDLLASGDKKVQTIKCVREMTHDCGLVKAKNLVESFPPFNRP